MSADPGHTALMRALNATDDDLSENRAGQLSSAQAARLRANRRRVALTGAAVLVTAILLATMALFLGQINRSQVLTVVGILITIAAAIYGSTVVRNWFRLTSDIDAAQVEAIIGTVQHTVRVAGRSATYIFKIDSHELVVPKSVFLAVKNGGIYRFYRTLNARVLLSGEATDTGRTRT